MEWPLEAFGDAVIVRQESSTASRFLVHSSDGAPLACASYSEAEGHAASYAERARANVWYVERGRPQLVCSFCHLRQETPLPESQESAEACAPDTMPEVDTDVTREVVRGAHSRK